MAALAFTADAALPFAALSGAEDAAFVGACGAEDVDLAEGFAAPLATVDSERFIFRSLKKYPYPLYKQAQAWLQVLVPLPRR